MIASHSCITLVIAVLFSGDSFAVKELCNLPEILFAANGYIDSLLEDDEDLNNFIAAAKLKEMFEHRFSDDAEELLIEYRTSLGCTFSPWDLQELTSIYQDPDFRLLVDRCEQFLENESGPERIELKAERFFVLDSLISVLKVILLEHVFDTTGSDKTKYEDYLYSASVMLSDFSKDRIRALTEKLASKAYRKEINKRPINYHR